MIFRHYQPVWTSYECVPRNVMYCSASLFHVPLPFLRDVYDKICNIVQIFTELLLLLHPVCITRISKIILWRVQNMPDFAYFLVGNKFFPSCPNFVFLGKILLEGKLISFGTLGKWCSCKHCDGRCVKMWKDITKRNTTCEEAHYEATFELQTLRRQVWSRCGNILHRKTQIWRSTLWSNIWVANTVTAGVVKMWKQKHNIQINTFNEEAYELQTLWRQM